MERTRQDTLDQLTLIVGRLNAMAIEQQQQSRASEEALRATREREEAQFRQAMVAMFQQQQQAMTLALRPYIIRAWQMVGAAALLLVLLFVGSLLLLKQANERLEVAEQRTAAAEVKAEVAEASRYVEITSCGGRPCVGLDKNAPIWKSKGREYIMVDGKN